MKPSPALVSIHRPYACESGSTTPSRALACTRTQAHSSQSAFFVSLLGAQCARPPPSASLITSPTANVRLLRRRRDRTARSAQRRFPVRCVPSGPLRTWAQCAASSCEARCMPRAAGGRCGSRGESGICESCPALSARSHSPACGSSRTRQPSSAAAARPQCARRERPPRQLCADRGSLTPPNADAPAPPPAPPPVSAAADQFGFDTMAGAWPARCAAWRSGRAWKHA
jgi:hypothetical protein